MDLLYERRVLLFFCAAPHQPNCTLHRQSVCVTSEHVQFFNAFEGTLLLTIFQDNSELYERGNSRTEKRIPQQSK